MEEVVVTAEQIVTGARDLRAWMALLVGRYSFEGHVDLCGNGDVEDQRPVTGNADCVAFDASPNVQCAVQIRWPETRGENGLPVPGGVSNLDPALVLFSLEKRHVPDSGGSEAAFRAAVRTGKPMTTVRTGYWGLLFTQLDNRGIVEWGSGVLLGDTFTSREACVGMPGSCQKITRITAKPGGDVISMVVDIAIDSRRVLRQAFRLRRAPISHQNQIPGEVSP